MKPLDTLTVAQAQNLIDKAYDLGISQGQLNHEDRIYPADLSTFLKNPFDLPAGYIVGQAGRITIGIAPEGDSHS